MTDRLGLPVLRDGNLKPPCEKPNIKCPKGHWSKPIELRAGDRKLIELYEASVASGGAMLTEAERRDEILHFVFPLLHMHYEAVKRSSIVSAAATVLSSLASR